MELSTKQKGNLTELQCLSAFVANGFTISIPYGDNAKYDFIADYNGKLLKIQVKTASQKDDDKNAIKFSCRSTHVNCKGVSNERYSEDEIDYFATYWDNKCYIVPVRECSATKTLRFVPPSNGRLQGITFAKDYELQNQLSQIKGGSN